MTVHDWQAVRTQGGARAVMRFGGRQVFQYSKAMRMPGFASQGDAVFSGGIGHTAAELVGPNQSGALHRGSRPTLLIVDDQPLNIHALSRALKQDYQLLVATDGMQAVELCRSANPDLVLLDVVMPGMDGYAVCQRLKSDETTRRIPIIFITASAAAGDESRCLEAGAVDFISKPVNPAVLQSRVRTHLTLKQQSDRLRQAGDELASAQRLGKVGSWHWDLLTGRLEMSEQLRSMLEIQNLSDDLAIQRVRTRLLNGSWWRSCKAVASAKLGRSSENVELQYHRPDGTTGHLLCNMEAMANKVGEVTAVRCTVLDVTDRARGEQLRIEKEAAELASEHKTQFLSSMSHELRTPLNAVLGFAQLLSFEPPIQHDRSLQTKVDHIMNAGNHLLSMVADILDLASINAGKVVLSTTSVEAVQVVRDVLAMTAPESQSRNLRVTTRMTQEQQWVQADHRRLRQVLLNLISNAIKYNRHGGEIHVDVWSTVDEVRFDVSDTGQGLSDDQVNHLFEPFNRLGAERSSTQGTGIGLVLCQSLAQAMGGRIVVKSAPGSGSTFMLCLRKPAPDPRLADQDV